MTNGRGRTRGVLVAVVSLSLVLAGCAGAPGPTTSTDATSGSTSTTATTGSPTPTTTTPGSDTPRTTTPGSDTPRTTTTGGGTPGGWSPNGTLAVHFINVGQSESILVVAPSGETMLVDTGDYRNDGEYVLEYLQRQNVTRIDYLVSSHNDADHIGGLAEVITYYETEANGVGAVYEQGIAASSVTYADYLDAVERYGVTVFVASAGADIPLAGANVTVYAPPEDSLANRARNENSVVLELGYGNASFLLPGDAGAREEEYLVEEYGDELDATVLKVGHHGSRTSSTRPFLAAVSPRLATISSHYESQYGHPHVQVLDALAAANVTTFWTAIHGTVVMTTDGSAIRVATQRAAPTNPRSLRDAPPVEPVESGSVVVRCVLTVSDESRPESRPGVDDGVPSCDTEEVAA